MRSRRIWRITSWSEFSHPLIVQEVDSIVAAHDDGEDDVDDLLNELDGELDKETRADLPEVPTSIPTTSPAKDVSCASEKEAEVAE